MAHITEELLRECARGQLPLRERIQVMEHIAECDGCAGRFAALMGEAGMVSPPPDLKRDILRRTVHREASRQAAADRQRRRQKKTRDLFYYSARVVFAMAASIVMFFTMSFPEREQVRETPSVVVRERQSASGERKKPVVDSLQNVSGKMGGVLTDILDFLDHSK